MDTSSAREGSFETKLSATFERTLKTTDETLLKALTIVEKSPSKQKVVLSQEVVRKLDEIPFKLRVWANDLFSRSGLEVDKTSSMLRYLSTWDSFKVVGSTLGSVAQNCLRIFEQIEAASLAIAEILERSPTSLKDQQSASKDINGWIAEVEKLFIELDANKETVQRQIGDVPKEKIVESLRADKDKSIPNSSILSLDGGGVRSYSSLLIVRALMDQIRSIVEENPEGLDHRLSPKGKSLRPADVFEYIAGSSSGGLIAIMLGRLKMAEADCQEMFLKYNDEIFSHPSRRSKYFSGRGRRPKYDQAPIVKATKRIVGHFDPSTETHKWKRNLFASPGDRVKTAVMSWNASSQESHILRSYDAPRSPQSGLRSDSDDGKASSCQIWEVARATAAAPGYFAPINLNGNLFVDGGVGTNNPSMAIFNEALGFTETTYPPLRLSPKYLVISIGSGIRSKNTAKVGHGSSRFLPRFWFYASYALQSLTHTEKVTQEVLSAARSSESVKYFRFNVQDGLEDIELDTWEVHANQGRRTFTTAQRIASATTKYLQRPDIQQQIRECAELLIGRKRFGFISPQGFSFLPPLDTQNFVGRADVLSRLDHLVQTERRVALVGLGGIGKTEIALKYCSTFREQHPEAIVLWIKASTLSSCQESFGKIARLANINSEDETNIDYFQLVSNWLRDNSNFQCLLVFDDLSMHLTSGSDGDADQEFSLGVKEIVDLVDGNKSISVIITTRDMRLGINVARRNCIRVTEFTQEEAEQLLELKIFEHKMQPTLNVQDFLSELGYLPLAISGAASYINEHLISLEEYVRLFREDKDRVLSKDLGWRSESNTSSSVFQTFASTFDQIKQQNTRAAQMLSLMAVIDSSAVPKLLLEEAGEQEMDFVAAIGTLKAYGLFQDGFNDDMFKLRPLVHGALQWWLEMKNEIERCREKATQALSKIFPSEFEENWTTCAVLYPHVQVVGTYAFQSTEAELSQGYLLGKVAVYDMALGRFEEAYNKSARCIEARTRNLGTDDPDSLSVMRLAGHALELCGKYKEAQEMLEQGLEQSENSFGNEDDLTLSLKSSLAFVYAKSARLDEAEELSLEVVETRRRIFGEESLETLRSMSFLGFIYRQQSKWKEAEDLLITSMQKFKRVLGDDHPETLKATLDLAQTYQQQAEQDEFEDIGMHQEQGPGDIYERQLAVHNGSASMDQAKHMNAAIELLENVAEVQEKTMGKEALSRLKTQHALARAYLVNGQIADAVQLLEQVVKVCKKTLDGEHHLLLDAQRDLEQANRETKPPLDVTELHEPDVVVDKT